MRTTSSGRALTGLVLVYGVASLIHFLHNGLYLGEYPRMPTWLTPFGVYGAWLVVAAVGCTGYALYRWAARTVGLLVITVYALMGFDSLGHYAMAPFAAHSVAMNATILGEVSSAAVLLVFTAYLLITEARTARSRAQRTSSPF